jgi:hypothetical protein
MPDLNIAQNSGFNRKGPSTRLRNNKLQPPKPSTPLKQDHKSPQCGLDPHPTRAPDRNIGNQLTSAAVARKRPPLTNTSELTCYRCGQKGHIASDPKCPQYQSCQTRLRINTQRVLGNDIEHPESEPQSAIHNDVYQYVNSWGGSQFESQNEYPDHTSQADGADDAPAGEEDDEDNDDPVDVTHKDNKDKVRMASMHVHVNAMHVENSPSHHAIYTLRYLDNIIIIEVNHQAETMCILGHINDSADSLAQCGNSTQSTHQQPNGIDLSIRVTDEYSDAITNETDYSDMPELVPMTWDENGNEAIEAAFEATDDNLSVADSVPPEEDPEFLKSLHMACLIHSSNVWRKPGFRLGGKQPSEARLRVYYVKRVRL